MKLFSSKILVYTVVSLIGGLSVIQAQTPVATMSHTTPYAPSVCNEANVSAAYYVGYTGAPPHDLFPAGGGNTQNVKFDTPGSWISTYDLGGIVGPFVWGSDIIPASVDQVVVMKSDQSLQMPTKAGLLATFPGYTRSDMYAQIVYHLKRNTYPNGGLVLRPGFYLTLGAQESVEAYLPIGGTPLQNEGNECYNIHVGYCGDGIQDDSNNAFLINNINGKLAGGEVCDNGSANGVVPDPLPYNSSTGIILSYCGSDCQPATVTGGYCGDGAWDMGFEECGEPDAPVCSGTAECIQCQCEEQTPVCNSQYNGQSFYTTDITYLDTAILCEPPFIASDPIYNPALSQRTWTCGNMPGAVTCQANRLYCGNNDLENGNQTQFPPSGASEQCDGINNPCLVQDGQQAVCNASCQCEYTIDVITGSCNFDISGVLYTGNTSPDVPFSLYGQSLCSGDTVVDTTSFLFDISTQTWTWSCLLLDNSGTSYDCGPIERLYCGNFILENGNQTQFPPSGASEQCEVLSDGSSQGCSGNQICNNLCGCETPPPIPECGSNVDQVIYIAQNNGNSTIDASAPGLCSVGSTVEIFAYNPGTHTWTWTCSNAAGQTSPLCSVGETWCGDGEGVPTVYRIQYSDVDPVEQCDFGDDNMDTPCEAPYGGSCNYCTTTCQNITLTGGFCGDGMPDTGELCDDGVNNGVPCGPAAYGEFCQYCSGMCEPQVVTGPRCGDGIYHDPLVYSGSTEQCDGNDNVPQDYRCNEMCQLICDDPNAINYGELEMCEYVGTFCGDGAVQNLNDQGLAELCDEGQDNTNGCTPVYGLDPGCSYCEIGTCVPKTQSLLCGDGIWTQQYEQCEDDGQLGITDSVTQLCQDCSIICKDPEAINYLQPGICEYPKNYCGDGIIQSPNDDGQFEACDDGVNNGPLGYCSSMCTINTSDPKYPDLVIEKTIFHQSSTIVSATGTISFQLRYVNAGAAPAVGVVIRDVLPAHLQYLWYQSAPGLNPPTINGQELTFTIGVLMPGQGGTITIHTTKLAQNICLNTTNTATITIPPGDPTPGNNTSTVAIPCDEGLCQSLSVVEHAGTAPLTSYFNCQGQGTTYVISIYNQQGVLIHTINAPSGAYTFNQPGTYNAVCTVDGRTSSMCQQKIDVTGRCEQLSVDISSGASVPLTGNLSCTGNGEIFEILLYKDNILQKSWKQVGGPVMKVSYTFTQAGKRSAICYVDGVSNPVCNATDLSAKEHFVAQSIVEQPQSLVFNDQQLYQFKKSLVVKQYDDPALYDQTGVLDTSILFEGKQREEMQQFIDKDMQIKQQADDLISTYISRQFSEVSIISKQASSTNILVQQSPFHEYIKRQSQIYTTTQQKHCHDTCAVDFVLVTPPNLGYCGDNLIQSPNGSGFNEQCDHGMTGNNGTSVINGVICDKDCKKVAPPNLGYCGDNLIQSPNGSGFNEQCDHGMTGNNGTIIINGIICDKECKKVTPGGGGGGGTSGSYGGTPPSTPPSSGGSRCGDGKRDAGEACDLGSANGSNSLCTNTCTLRGFTTNSPLCEYVDPPSIQIGEPLPLWWNYEGDSSIVTNTTCSTGSVGTISRDSLTCHFAILNPLGEEVDRISTDCEQDSMRQQPWYQDFVTTLDRDTRSLLLQSRGVGVWDSNRIINKNPIFGEYAVRLDRISYDVCRWDGTSFAYAADSYDERVCQYNFSVTHPYLIQKSVTNSSTVDDIKILEQFYDFAGNRLLADINFTPIKNRSSSDILGKIDAMMKQYSDTATMLVRDAGHPLFGYRKASNRELYIMDATQWTIDTTLSFNRGKTTIVYAPNATDIMIKGSLDARLVLLAPRATIQFINTDCHVSDTIGGIYVAADFTTNSIKNQTNQEQRCTGGGLVIDGMLIGGIADSITALAQRRRSTLNNWFTTRDKDDVIFDGASLRIQANPSLWNDMPTLMSELMEVLTVTK